LTRKTNRIFGEEEEPYFVREEEESKLKLELKKQSEISELYWLINLPPAVNNQRPPHTAHPTLLAVLFHQCHPTPTPACIETHPSCHLKKQSSGFAFSSSHHPK
jgi:hypothetical protein